MRPREAKALSVVSAVKTAGSMSGSFEKPLLAAKTARSRAKVPIAIAGRGEGEVGVEMMPKGMLEMPKWESGGMGSQDEMLWGGEDMLGEVLGGSRVEGVVDIMSGYCRRGISRD